MCSVRNVLAPRPIAVCQARNDSRWSSDRVEVRNAQKLLWQRFDRGRKAHLSSSSLEQNTDITSIAKRVQSHSLAMTSIQAATLFNVKGMVAFVTGAGTGKLMIE